MNPFHYFVTAYAIAVLSVYAYAFFVDRNSK